MTVFLLACFALIINVPFGLWRSRYPKFTLPWWLFIHASVPFIVALRVWLATPRVYIPLFIALAVLGQLLGKMWSIKRGRKKAAQAISAN